MLSGPTLVQALKSCGVTDVVWLPDSHLGQWEEALRTDPQLRLIRVAREGEAIAVAAGLMIGGRRPVVMIQCTGLFEAGDALRNVVHDLQLPLFLIVGLRSYFLHRQGQGNDTCPVFTLPILKAWQLPHVLFDEQATAEDLVKAYRTTAELGHAGAVVIGE
jgi:sulfopyruvate decarboxylase TPP-binding subunit